MLGGAAYRKSAGLTPMGGMVAVTSGTVSKVETATNGLKHAAMVPFASTRLNGLNKLGSLVIDVNISTMNVSFITSSNVIADSFVITKS